ncbi:MAG: GSCFA domain-containing protein [Salibacteraceae bacterium]
MDSFRTRIDAPKFPFEIAHASKVSLSGSCFAQNMGEKLQGSKIDVTVNPFGILFNPFSIMNALERMLNNRPYTKNELIQVGDNYVSLDHHGEFNNTDPNAAIKNIQYRFEAGRTHLIESDVIFITLGSAWAYHHLAENHTVANCHKIPNKEFEKRLLSYQDVHLILRHIPQFFASKKMKAQVVFTVSPVRHWKDGPVENQHSKSILHAATQAVVQEFDNCHYFPSYEFMMDDLRVYRFYGQDMLHATPQAIDYIWEKFQESFFSEETKAICKEVKAIVDASAHRPMDPESNSYQRFVKKQLELIDLLEVKYPVLDLTSEKQHLKGFLL